MADDRNSTATENMQISVSPDVIERVQRQLQDHLAKTITESLGWKVSEQAGAFFKEHVAPAVAEQLVARKEDLVAAAVAAAGLAMTAACEAMQKKMIEALATDYKMSQALRALIG